MDSDGHNATMKGTHKKCGAVRDTDFNFEKRKLEEGLTPVILSPRVIFK